MRKIKTSIVTTIDCQELDRIVAKTYNRPYSFQQQDGCKGRGNVYVTVPSGEWCEDYDNDTIPEVVNGSEMGASFAAWLARDPKQKLNSTDKWEREHGLDLWWSRSFYPHIDMVLDDLHSKGLIDAGEYTIVIDW